MDVYDFNEMRTIMAICGGDRGLGSYIDLFAFEYKWNPGFSSVEELSFVFNRQLSNQSPLVLKNHPIMPNPVVEFNETECFTIEDITHLFDFECALQKQVAEADKTEEGPETYAPTVMLLYTGDGDSPFDFDDYSYGKVQYLDEVIENDEVLELLTGREIDEIEIAVEELRKKLDEREG